MGIEKIESPCGLKSAASSRLRISTRRGECKYLKAISLAFGGHKEWSLLETTAGPALVVAPHDGRPTSGGK